MCIGGVYSVEIYTHDKRKLIYLYTYIVRITSNLLVNYTKAVVIFTMCTYVRISNIAQKILCKC